MRYIVIITTCFLFILPVVFSIEMIHFSIVNLSNATLTLQLENITFAIISPLRFYTISLPYLTEISINNTMFTLYSDMVILSINETYLLNRCTVDSSTCIIYLIIRATHLDSSYMLYCCKKETTILLQTGSKILKVKLNPSLNLIKINTSGYLSYLAASNSIRYTPIVLTISHDTIVLSLFNSSISKYLINQLYGNTTKQFLSCIHENTLLKGKILQLQLAIQRLERERMELLNNITILRQKLSEALLEISRLRTNITRKSTYVVNLSDILLLVAIGLLILNVSLIVCKVFSIRLHKRK